MRLMKLITAVIRPFKLDVLRDAVAHMGVQGVTVTELHEIEFGARCKVEIAVDDAIAEAALEAIANVARTGRAGDGHITIVELDEAIRIRTGETGTAAT
jgi:nitrogen regulatory protein P-II 2